MNTEHQKDMQKYINDYAAALGVAIAEKKEWEAKEKQYAAREQRLREIAKRLRHSTKCNIHAACYGLIEPCDCGLQDLRAILNRKQEKQP